MAVAPIDQARAVLEYAVTEIPRNKIMMGIPCMAMTGRFHTFPEASGPDPSAPRRQSDWLSGITPA